jgi:hypothetical protein
VPFFLIAILGASVFLAGGSRAFLMVLGAQLACYLSALLAWTMERAGTRNRLLALPQYFALSNLASLIAWYKFLRGERFARWEPIRERVPARQQTRAIAPHEVQ